MARTRTEEFYINGFGFVTREECLRALVAAVYDTAKVCGRFTTDDVFARVKDYPEYNFRKALSTSKLIAVALQKAVKRGMCYFALAQEVGGPVCHSRRKGVWVSKLANPQFTSVE